MLLQRQALAKKQMRAISLIGNFMHSLFFQTTHFMNMASWLFWSHGVAFKHDSSVIAFSGSMVQTFMFMPQPFKKGVKK